MSGLHCVQPWQPYFSLGCPAACQAWAAQTPSWPCATLLSGVGQEAEAGSIGDTDGVGWACAPPEIGPCWPGCGERFWFCRRHFQQSVAGGPPHCLVGNWPLVPPQNQEAPVAHGWKREGSLKPLSTTAAKAMVGNGGQVGAHGPHINPSCPACTTKVTSWMAMY